MMTSIQTATLVCNNNEVDNEEVRRINFEHDDTHDQATPPTNDNPVFNNDI